MSNLIKAIELKTPLLGTSDRLLKVGDEYTIREKENGGKGYLAKLNFIAKTDNGYSLIFNDITIYEVMLQRVDGIYWNHGSNQKTRIDQIKNTKATPVSN